MADVKWIKIVTDIFDNRKIKLIRKMPEGDAIVVTWFQLLCLAGEVNDNGLVYITRTIPYTDETLSTAFDTPLSIIRLSLDTFTQLEMVKNYNSFFCVANWEKYQNVDALEKMREQTRIRVERHRENQRRIMASRTCQYCGSPATGFDHILAIARGGSNEPANMVECCVECNRIKNDKPLVNFLNDNRGRIRDDIVASNIKLSALVSLCNVTDRYTVTQCNATEEERRKKRGDIEQDKRTDKPQLSSDKISAFSDKLSAKVNEWLRYKKEIKDKYTETGLNSLLARIEKNAALFGDDAIIDLIDNSISNGWKGIIWDKMSKAPKEESQYRRLD